MGRRRRWATEAAMQALVRYGPEKAGLDELERQARGTYRSARRSARSTSNAVVNAVNEARPEVKRVYDAAGLHQAAIASAGNESLTGLEGVNPTVLAAIQGEQTAARSRIGESRAAALTDLSSRKVGAREGRQFAVQAAGRQFAEDISKVFARRQSLAQEQGAFTAATMGDLAQQDRQRRQQLRIAQGGWSQSERGSLRAAGINPDTGKPIPGGKLDPDANKKPGDQSKGKSGSSGGATNAQYASAGDQIQLALSEGRTLKKLGATREEIAELLKSGAKAKETPLHDPQTGKPVYNADGTPKMKTVPGVPQIKSQLLLAAALDQLFYGHITPENAKRLRARGLHPRKLPVTPYQQWLSGRGKSDAAQG